MQCEEELLPERRLIKFGVEILGRGLVLSPILGFNIAYKVIPYRIVMLYCQNDHIA